MSSSCLEANPGEGRILLSAESEAQNIELRTAEGRREVKSWAEEKSLESQFTSSLDIPELFNVAVPTKLLQGSRCFLRFIPFAAWPSPPPPNRDVTWLDT